MALEIKTDVDVRKVFGLDRDALADVVIDGFLREYSSSESASMPRSELKTWTEEELDELMSALRGDEVCPRENLMYSGDVVKGADPAFAPLENFIEDKIIVSRMLFGCIWQAHAGEPRYAQEAVAALEKATLQIIRTNMHYFADNALAPGCLSRNWQGSVMRNNQPAGPADSLSDREREVALLASEGLSNGEISGRLNIARNTVKNHLARAFMKTGTSNRTELARWVIEQGLR